MSDSQHETLIREAREVSEAISTLPLAPVNCPASIRVDMAVRRAAVMGHPYLLRAPLNCNACKSERNEKTRKVWKDGIIMCTIGPCSLHVEHFKCSRSDCTSTIHTEGRDHCILVYTVASAATHALLRRELSGVVLANGTINSRLTQYHSDVMATIHSGVLPAWPPCRSVGTLHKLCSLMVRLMTSNPEESLFRCGTCMSGIICCDGIQQGYDKRKQVRLKNISEGCEAIPASRTMSQRSTQRPSHSFFRKENTANVLLKTLQRKEVACTKRNVTDMVLCVRLLRDDIIPSAFCRESILGRTRGDFGNDCGEQSYRMCIKTLTESFFDTASLIYRLLKGINEYISRLTLEAISEMVTTVPGTDALHISAATRSMIAAALASYQGEPFSWLQLSGSCWLNGTDTQSRRGQDTCKEIMNMFAVFIQGPILHFVRRTDVASLANLGHKCLMLEPDEALQAVQTPETLVSGDGQTSILASSRIIRAGLMNVLQIERKLEGDEARIRRKALGKVLMASAQFVREFYEYYDAPLRDSTAVTYASNWKSQDRQVLMTNMSASFPEYDAFPGNVLQDALKTGNYFPAHPQLRPLPFNTEEISAKHSEQLGPCSKQYLQRQSSYTPGAMTLTCACPRPIIFGTKVLYRNEGPKVVLDMIISRFASLPRFIVYDFACGLYHSAVHSLWWALEETTIVCDKFHATNHKACSPSYLPGAYPELDSKNTVSHEQRNRGIKLLARSLRNSAHPLYTALLAYHAIIENIKANAQGTETFKSRGNRSLLSQHDLEWCYYQCLRFKCTCCITNIESN